MFNKCLQEDEIPGRAKETPHVSVGLIGYINVRLSEFRRTFIAWLISTFRVLIHSLGVEYAFSYCFVLFIRYKFTIQ